MAESTCRPITMEELIGIRQKVEYHRRKRGDLCTNVDIAVDPVMSLPKNIPQPRIYTDDEERY